MPASPASPCLSRRPQRAPATGYGPGAASPCSRLLPMARSLRRIKLRTAGLAIACVVLAAAGGVRAADSATITFQRVFKGSNPEFIRITVSEDGTATYDIRQLSEDS